MNRIYSARELIRRGAEPGPYHNFPEVFNKSIFEQGTNTRVPNFYNQAKPGLSADSIQYRLPGTINGKEPVASFAGVRLGIRDSELVEQHRRDY